MASATSTLLLPSPPNHRPHAGSFRPPKSNARVAHRSWRRWLLRLAFAAPLIATGLFARDGGFRSGDNQALLDRAALIHWGSADLSFVARVYPPVPSVLAWFLPNPDAVLVLGCLAGGVMLEEAFFRLRAEGRSWPVLLLLLVPLGVSPGFVISAATNLQAFLALALLVLALDGFIRFVAKAQTVGGFQAGLAVGLAGLCDPQAIVYAVGFALAAPLLVRGRNGGERGAGRATAAVLIFPTVAGMVGWTFLCWRFTGDAFGWFPSLTAPDAAGRMDASLHALGRALAVTPVYLYALLLIARRRHLLTMAAAMLPAACLLVVALLRLPLGVGPTAALLGIIGIAVMPRRLRRVEVLGLGVVALGGLVLKWSTITNPVAQAWLHALLHQ